MITSTAPGRVSVQALAEIDALQLLYISALDGKRMNDWLGTFADVADASYTCTTAENTERNLPVSWILDDNHMRLEDRVTFVTKMWVGIFTDYRTRHFVQRTRCEPAGENVYDVESHYMVLSVPGDTQRPEVFASGVYLDRVQIGQQGARFLSKKAINDGAVVQRYLVFPL